MIKSTSYIIITLIFAIYVHALKFNEHILQENVKNNIKHQEEQEKSTLRLTTSVIVSYVDQNYQKNSINSFWDNQQFSQRILPQKIKSDQQLKVLQQFDILNKIQVGSYYDYLQLINKIDFNKLSLKMENALKYKIYTFPKNKSFRRNTNKINLTDNFKLYDQLQIISKLNNDKQQDQPEWKLQKALLLDPNNPIIRQIQYKFYQQKYNIGQNNQQTSFCVYSSGYKMFSKNKYKLFFETLSRQNYTNFHIVYIDDNSPQNQVKGIYQYLIKTNSNLQNKITIIHTLQHLGALANKYFWIRKYCKPNDVIVNIDSDDGLIGTQVFQVLNSLYKNENIWFVYSRYILQQFDKENGNNNLYYGFSQTMHTPVKDYRNDFQHWDVSHLRTFRKELFSKIPIYMMLQYKYSQEQQKVYPYFFQFAQDTFQIFSMLEMCGQEHFKYVNDFLYVYSGAQSGNQAKCYGQREKIDDFKSRIKTPFKQLNSLNDQAQHVQNYKPPDSTFLTLKFVEQQYQKCLDKK